MGIVHRLASIRLRHDAALRRERHTPRLMRQEAGEAGGGLLGRVPHGPAPWGRQCSLFGAQPPRRWNGDHSTRSEGRGENEMR